MILRNKHFLILIPILFWLGCGSSSYISTSETDQMDDKFSNTDLSLMSQEIYQSIIKRLNSLGWSEDSVPILAFVNILNKTTDYINTEDIADKIQIDLIKNGTLRFVDRTMIDQMFEQFDMSTSGIMDPATSKEAGKILGNDFFLYGEMSSITKNDKKKRQTYYRLSMRMVDSETNEIVWADESELKKQTSKSFMDW